jgi:predicted small integral membrane protein
MRFAAGIILLTLAAVVGIVEFMAITHSEVAHQVSKAFAEHDPFSPRGPLELHVFSIILFLGFLVGGISLLRKRRVNATQTI